MKHDFLTINERQIYCNIYIPLKRTEENRGIILCKPIWGERIRTHRIFTNLSRLLADHGFHVITCDYYGDGNSLGDTLDLSFDGMVNDINNLFTYFKNNYSSISYSLVGLRIGATVAMAAAPFIKPVEKIILIEPILSLTDYLKEGLRANLTSQMTAYKKIIKNRDLLIEDIKNGIPVNMDGFMIGKKLWQSFEKVDPQQLSQNINSKVILFSIVESRKKGNNIDDSQLKFSNKIVKFIHQEFIWTDWKYYQPNPPIFFKEILSELR